MHRIAQKLYFFDSGISALMNWCKKLGGGDTFIFKYVDKTIKISLSQNTSLSTIICNMYIKFKCAIVCVRLFGAVLVVDL